MNITTANHLIVSWYPEHKETALWEHDLELMVTHGFTGVRLFEFAWSSMEPSEGFFDFSWAKTALQLCRQQGLAAVICTPSAALPPWLTIDYPETTVHNVHGLPSPVGGRRTACMTSPVMRTFANRIARRMYDELSGEAELLAWQIDNELGADACLCPACHAAFRESLQQRFDTVESFNQAIGSAFWSMKFSTWEEVRLPDVRSGNHLPAMIALARRFWSDQTAAFLREQVQTLKRAGATVPITTNVNADYQQVDLWQLTREIDVVSWDAYDDGYTLAGLSFAHSLVRSLKPGTPYWSMENCVNSVGMMMATPPGFNIVTAVNALAHGESVHGFWRWESTPSGQEQNHLGFIDYTGKPRAKLREVPEMAAAAAAISALELPPLQPRVAVLHSWDNFWAVGKYFGHYLKEIDHVMAALHSRGIPVDVRQGHEDLSSYALVIAPGFVLSDDDVRQNLENYVQSGGVLFATRMAFSKNLINNYLTVDRPAVRVFGLRILESQSDRDAHDLSVSCWRDQIPTRSWKLHGEGGLPDTCSDGWWEALELAGATPLYHWSEGICAGLPAAAEYACGAGHTYYLGTMIDPAAMRALITRIADRAGIYHLAVPAGTQAVNRGTHWILTNHTGTAIDFPLPFVANLKAGNATAIADGVCLPGFGWGVVEV